MNEISIIFLFGILVFIIFGIGFLLSSSSNKPNKTHKYSYRYTPSEYVSLGKEQKRIYNKTFKPVSEVTEEENKDDGTY